MKSIFLFIIPILCLMFPCTLLPEASQEETEKVDRSGMIIKSDSLEIDNKRKIVVFAGNVDARGDNLIINCQKMLLYYHDRQPGEGEGKENIKIDKIVATGKVKISRTNGGLALAEKAVYYRNDEKVVLTGKPVVKQGNDFVEGARITLFLKENRSIVEGSENKKVRAVISPRSEKKVTPLSSDRDTIDNGSGQ